MLDFKDESNDGIQVAISIIGLLNPLNHLIYSLELIHSGITYHNFLVSQKQVLKSGQILNMVLNILPAKSEL